MTKRLGLGKKKKKKDGMTAKDNWAGLEKKYKGKRKIPKWLDPKEIEKKLRPKTITASKGGMVKSYATGGSVSRGQYPAQARKVKFKGVF